MARPLTTKYNAAKTKADLQAREMAVKMANKGEPIGQAPEWLSDVAKSEYNRVAPQINLIDLDVALLSNYCVLYENLRNIEQSLTETGTVIDGKPNPLIRSLNETSARLRSVANDLGLSPQARLKISVKKVDEARSKDPFKELMMNEP